MMEQRFHILVGDITQQNTEAIVNASNTSLTGGGSVDAAIHKAAGPQLLEACRGLGGCPAGEARLTPGFLLPARWVIHTPGPMWQGGDHQEAEHLAASYRACLELARREGIRSLSFPSISTGTFHFPVNQAAGIAVRTILDFLREDDILELVQLVCFDQRTAMVYEIALRQLTN